MDENEDTKDALFNEKYVSHLVPFFNCVTKCKMFFFIIYNYIYKHGYKYRGSCLQRYNMMNFMNSITREWNKFLAYPYSLNEKDITYFTKNRILIQKMFAKIDIS